MKRQYETVYEIFNKCANNQMRDVFIDEVELEETALEDYLKKKIRDRTLTFERSVQPDGTIVYDIDASGIRQRLSFTPID